MAPPQRKSSISKTSSKTATVGVAAEKAGDALVEQNWTDEERAAKEQELRDLAQTLRDAADVSQKDGGTDKSADLILRFAAEVEVYANRVRDASSSEEAKAIANDAAAKNAKWMKMLNMLVAKQQESDPEEQAKLAQAEQSLAEMAVELRKSASKGSGSATKRISEIAALAEACLQAFRQAKTPQEKWAVYATMETGREQWVKNLTDLKANFEKNFEARKQQEEHRQKMHDDFVAKNMEQIAAQEELQSLLAGMRAWEDVVQQAEGGTKGSEVAEDEVAENGAGGCFSVTGTDAVPAMAKDVDLVDFPLSTASVPDASSLDNPSGDFDSVDV